MTDTEQGWRPTVIRRSIKPFPTSACTVLVETDAGPGYLKAMGSPEGLHILACEWVATQLARWFKLPTFDFSIIQVGENDEIPFHDGGAAQPGPAFITRAEFGETWGGKVRQLGRLANLEDISRLVVFDTWTLNCDRYSLPAEGGCGRVRVNRNNVFLSEEAPKGKLLLKAMDHTHCFTCGRPLSKRLADIGRMKERRVFGLFPEFREILDRRKLLSRQQVGQAAADLRQVSRAIVASMARSIPVQWDVSRDTQDALVDLIVGRAAFVADTIASKLWPQHEFDFPKTMETEQST